jgi:fermentation-respiration switch protein FrsA (DUF1100 family)
MRSLRRHFEWLDLLKRIERDRKSRVLTGKSELLAAGEILMADPATAAEREEVVSNIPRMEEYQSTAYSLATAEMLLKFKPADVVHRIFPRAILYVAAELDSVTPADDVLDMYERTKQPKKLKVIPGAAHYDVYRKSNLDSIMELATAWLGEHLARE